MANLRITWVLPTLRESGKALPADQIASVRLEQSADLGANFVQIDNFPRTVLETLVTDLEPGEWQFRGTVVDTVGRESKGKVSSFVIPDNTPPGALLELNIALA